MIQPKYADVQPSEDVLLDPFEQFNWKTAEARDQWNDLIQQMSEAKFEAEWRSVLDDETEREIAIIHVNNYNREEWMRRIGEHGLVYRDIRYSKPYSGFSHKFFPTNEHDLSRNTYSVIAEDPDVADHIKEVELEWDGPERHDEVGKHLGFPDCCREFFNDVWLDKGLIDPMYEISCNTPSARAVDGDRERVLLGDPNPGTNVMWRYFGLSFITHLPCSWECEESIEIARQRYRIMAENGYEGTANALADWLDTPFTWNGYHSIATVKNRYATSASSTSSYWSPKEVVWKRPHEPK